jgi:TrmH family RNA methyltransferase
MPGELSKAREALIKSLYTRHGRKKSGLCLCEGRRCCGEVLAACPDLIEFAVCREELAGEYPDAITVPDFKFSVLGVTETSQGILLVARKPEPLPEDSPMLDPFALVLDRVGDPGNFGTILRTAKAAGLRELWYTDGSADPFGDKTIRAAMSAQFTMNLRRFADLAALKNFLLKNGVERFFRTDPHEGESCFAARGLYERSAVIIGSEAHGVSELGGAVPVTIPMPGNFESLNAAQAATIFIFEYVRRTLTP